MRRSLTVVTLLLFLSAAVAGIRTSYHTLSRKGDGDARGLDQFIGVEENNLHVGQSRFATYDEKKANQWYVVGGRIRSSSTGKYLAYDAMGKDNRLVLRDGADAGTEWVVKAIRVTKEEERGSIQAVNGPFAGWAIDIVDGAPVLRKDPGNAFQAWRVYIHK